MDYGLVVTILFAFISLFLTVITLDNRKELKRAAKKLNRILKEYDEYGVSSIDHGKMKVQDANRMFEESIIIKMMYISGVNFVRDYRKKIKKSCDNGCKIKILLAMPNGVFITEHDKICKIDCEMNSNTNDEIKETIELIKKINEELIPDKQIEIKYYSTAFRGSLTICYDKENKAKARISVFAPPELAIDSMLLYAEREENDKNNKMNLVSRYEKHFDIIWNHFSSEPDFDSTLTSDSEY